MVGNTSVPLPHLIVIIQLQKPLELLCLSVSLDLWGFPQKERGSMFFFLLLIIHCRVFSSNLFFSDSFPKNLISYYFYIRTFRKTDGEGLTPFSFCCGKRRHLTNGTFDLPVSRSWAATIVGTSAKIIHVHHLCLFNLQASHALCTISVRHKWYWRSVYTRFWRRGVQPESHMW